MEVVLSGLPLLLVYLAGQLAVAIAVPLLNYRLTKPHLERTERKADQVAVKVEEVAQAVNGATIIKVDAAYEQGRADEKASQ